LKNAENIPPHDLTAWLKTNQIPNKLK